MPSSIAALVLLLPRLYRGLVPLCRRRWLGRSVGPTARLVIAPTTAAWPPSPRHPSACANRDGRGALNQSMPRERPNDVPITEQRHQSMRSATYSRKRLRFNTGLLPTAAVCILAPLYRPPRALLLVLLPPRALLLILLRPCPVMVFHSPPSRQLCLLL